MIGASDTAHRVDVLRRDGFPRRAAVAERPVVVRLDAPLETAVWCPTILESSPRVVVRIDELHHALAVDGDYSAAVRAELRHRGHQTAACAGFGAGFVARRAASKP